MTINLSIASVFAQEEFFPEETVITQNFNTFSPFSVSSFTYEVYDADNPSAGPIATIDTSANVLNAFFDDKQIPSIPDHTYPVIDFVRSEPFLCDSEGLVIQTDPQRELLNTATLEPVGVDSQGNLLWVKKIYIGIDYGFRTRFNLPPLQYYDIPISPFDNYLSSHAGRTDYDTFDKGGGSDINSEPNNEGAINRGINAGVYDVNTRDGWEGQILTQEKWLEIDASGLNYNNLVNFIGYQEIDTEPIGVIGATVDCGATGSWNVDYFVSGAVIRNSLFPFSPDLFFFNPTNPVLNSADLSIDDAQNFLESSFGNSPVIIVPKIRVDAINDLISFDYTKVLSDGSIATVKTTSAQMGFFSAKKVLAREQVGTITNTLQQQVDAIDYQFDRFPADSPIDITEDVTTSGNVGGTSPVDSILEAHFTYQNDNTVPSGGSAEIYSPFNAVDDTGSPVQAQSILSGNQMALPDNAIISSGFRLSPLTTSYYANYQLRYTGWRYDAAFPYFLDELDSITRKIQFPYKVGIQNTYAITRAVISVAILTTNRAEIIPTEGTPIDASDLTDHEIAELGLLPDFNDVEGVRTSVAQAELQALYDQVVTIMILVIIGIIAVAVLAGIIRARRR